LDGNKYSYDKGSKVTKEKCEALAEMSDAKKAERCNQEPTDDVDNVAQVIFPKTCDICI